MNPNPFNITLKTKWLLALAAYTLIVANLLWSFASDAPIITTRPMDGGGYDLSFPNAYAACVIFVNYVVIIHQIINAFNGHPRTTTFWVCLAAMTLMPVMYTMFGLSVLAYVLYPFVKKWMSAKFVQAVKSATASDQGPIPPHE